MPTNYWGPNQSPGHSPGCTRTRPSWSCSWPPPGTAPTHSGWAYRRLRQMRTARLYFPTPPDTLGWRRWLSPARCESRLCRSHRRCCRTQNLLSPLPAAPGSQSTWGSAMRQRSPSGLAWSNTRCGTLELLPNGCKKGTKMLISLGSTHVSSNLQSNRSSRRVYRQVGSQAVTSCGVLVEGC